MQHLSNLSSFPAHLVVRPSDDFGGTVLSLDYRVHISALLLQLRSNHAARIRDIYPAIAILRIHKRDIFQHFFPRGFFVQDFELHFNLRPARLHHGSYSFRQAFEGSDSQLDQVDFLQSPQDENIFYVCLYCHFSHRHHKQARKTRELADNLCFRKT